jgi:hypothetical protein
MREVSRDLIVRAFSNRAIIKFHDLVVREDVRKQGSIDLRVVS